MSFLKPALFLLFTIFALKNVFGARILCVFPVPVTSHQIYFQSIWRVLSLRGHQVVVFTPNPLNDKTLINLTEIDIKFKNNNKGERIDQKFSKNQYSIFGLIKVVDEIVHQLNRHIFEKSPEFKKIINDKKEKFDLIIIESYCPAFYALGYRFNAPVIGVVSTDLSDSFGADYIGVPSHPIIYPDTLLAYTGQSTLSNKIISCFKYLYQLYAIKYDIIPNTDKLVRKYMGDDMPYLETIAKNISLLFVNRNLVFHPPRALPPLCVELNQVQIKPVKPLPADLKEMMDNATEGIIYFSLGSNVLSSNLPVNLRKTIMDTFSELPYKVLWKFETNDLTDKPKNVVIRKWFPQQDILAHPNVKAFISQGGIHSLEESVSREVPLVVMPFMADQYYNAETIQKKGMGLRIDHQTVTKNIFKDAILEVAENKKYLKKVQEYHRLLLDQPMNSTEKLIWWTEYVLRHRGTTHLRTPVVDASPLDYYLLDVLGVVFVLPLVVALLLIYFIRKKYF